MVASRAAELTAAYVRKNRSPVPFVKYPWSRYNVKVTLFRSYCSPLYTSQLWWKYRVNSIRKLYVAYNNAFRMLFRLPRDCSASGMFAVNNDMSRPALVRKLVFVFYKRVNSSQNCIVQAICGSDIWWKSSIRSNWHRV